MQSTGLPAEPVQVRGVGYTGGFGSDDSWRGDGRRPGQWRDTNVRVEGMLVDQLQAAFVVNWAEATGDLLGERLFLLDRADWSGTQDAGVLYTDPGLGSTNAVPPARHWRYTTCSYGAEPPGRRKSPRPEAPAAAPRKGTDGCSHSAPKEEP